MELEEDKVFVGFHQKVQKNSIKHGMINIFGACNFNLVD